MQRRTVRRIWTVPSLYLFILLYCILLVTLACGCSNNQKGNQKYIDEGIAQYNNQKYDLAIINFDLYLSEDNTSIDAARAYAWQGVSYEELGNFNRALQCLDNATRIKQDEPTIWRAKERVFLEMGRNEEAAFAGRKAARL
ncbi:MAG: hypothetical protein LUP99_05455 [Methanomicrobiales archaeon]|nr:hypothetical protein [Methanomicrobiales archaeon]